ncbi:MAG: DNA cytosine methyltransferase [Acidobacteriota bacterium]|nr:DNA cytosine methyltransferase [Acidobacteriota bacterium]
MRSVELFSGCGGLALGTARAGFDHKLMVEWNADAFATLSLNKASGVEFARDWPFIRADVREVDWTAFGAGMDLVAGGPPCQPFSICGKHLGHDDVRDMWPEAIRAVRELRPRAFLFENVRGLTRPAFTSYLAWIKAALMDPTAPRKEDEGHEEHLARLLRRRTAPEYRALVLKINAADFGAAQKRNRVVVAGIHMDIGVDLSPLAQTHSRERLVWDKWVTGEYWQRHGMRAPSIPGADRPIAKQLDLFSTPPTTQPWRTVRDAISGLGEPNGDNWHVFQPGARSYPGHTGSVLDEPAKALKAGDHGVPGGENMMVLDGGGVRYFTVREAARLQGLPDEWGFATSWSESMRQIGNAVPVQLSEAIGKWIASTLRNVGHVNLPRRAA